MATQAEHRRKISTFLMAQESDKCGIKKNFLDVWQRKCWEILHLNAESKK
jgi:hypothetical protein